MKITLKITEGPHTGQQFEFEGHDTFIVGRSKRAHFQLSQKDEYFSRIHFLIEINPPECRLLDMNSSNGTFVNGQRVTVADLKHSDLIQAGHTVISVMLSNEKLCPPLQDSSDQDIEGFRSDPMSAPLPETVDYVPPPPVAYPSAACVVCSERQMLSSKIPVCAVCWEQSGTQPQPIPGYRLVQELGKGGMGIVSLAIDEKYGIPVALKTIQPKIVADERQAQRFLREASILCQLSHSYIVGFRQMGQAQDLLYFTMDYVPGIDAGQSVAQGGPLSCERAVKLICQLLEALQYAHSQQFVHRDIKPSNLLITTLKNFEEVRLADFGLARIYQSSQLSGLTMTGQVGGTLAFMPPEQIQEYREAKPAVDQYASAATLYYLLTGCYIHDFSGNQMDHILTILQKKPVPIRERCSDLPPALASVIDKALARDPENRYASADEMRKSLLNAMA